MDQIQQNQTGTPPQAPQEERSIGALIGSIIVVAIIVIGGIYFWMTRQDEYEMPLPGQISTNPPTIPIDQIETAALLNQGTSNEVSDIEKDLNASNFDNIDAGMKDIEAQL